MCKQEFWTSNKMGASSVYVGISKHASVWVPGVIKKHLSTDIWGDNVNNLSELGWHGTIKSL